MDVDNDTVEVNVLNGGAYECVAKFKGPGVLRSRPFEELDIELDEMWA